MSCVKGLLPKHSFRQNTISLTAGYPLGVRFLPPPASGYPGSNFTQFANSSRFKAGLRQYKLSSCLSADRSERILQPGTRGNFAGGHQKCSKSRFAYDFIANRGEQQSSSGPFDWGLTKIVWATSREDMTLWLLGSAGTVSY